MGEILDVSGRTVAAGSQLGRIAVPPRVAAQIALQNLVNAVLQLVHTRGDDGLALAELRRAYAIWGVSAKVAEHVEARLVREKLLRTDGVTFWMGTPADLRGFLARAALADRLGVS